MDDCLDRAPEEAVHMVVEHRLMHLETLAYMFHNFPLDAKRAPQSYKPPLTTGANRSNEWCEIPAGEAVLGQPRGAAFGWDNEYGEVRRRIPAFRVQRFPVSNGEYLQFVREGAPLPHFWIQKGEQIFLRRMFAEVPLPLDGPVYVTELQAEAYAAWHWQNADERRVSSIALRMARRRVRTGLIPGEFHRHRMSMAISILRHGIRNRFARRRLVTVRLG